VKPVSDMTKVEVMNLLGKVSKAANEDRHGDMVVLLGIPADDIERLSFTELQEVCQVRVADLCRRVDPEWVPE